MERLRVQAESDLRSTRVVQTKRGLMGDEKGKHEKEAGKGESTFTWKDVNRTKLVELILGRGDLEEEFIRLVNRRSSLWIIPYVEDSIPYEVMNLLEMTDRRKIGMKIRRSKTGHK